MKSSILCACLIMMLFFSTLAFGDIVWKHDWDGTGDVWGNFVGSSASADAYGDETDPDSWASGDWSLVTTVEGDFDYSWHYKASAFAWISISDSTPCSADAEAEAGGSHGSTLNADASVDESDCGPPPDSVYEYNEPADSYGSSWGNFQIYEGVYAGHTVSAEASIWSGSDNQASADADAAAAISFSEH